MADAPQAHPDDEIIERYALGRLGEPELGEVEEHVLICEPCQDRVAAAEEFATVMRKAAANVAVARPQEAWWRRWLTLDWLPMPAPALAAAMMVVLALGVWQPWRASAPAEWRTVELATLRGGEAKVDAAEGFALDLRLDAAGLAPVGLTAQIVGADGRVVTETAVAIEDAKVNVRYANGLKAGQYWVRLKQSGETVREFALPVASR